jgi:putative ABC transport system permease protein
MLLPAVSVSNVIMGGLLERRREFGIRRAFGASARQLLWQIWLENLVLSGLGALLAVVLLAIALVQFGRDAQTGTLRINLGTVVYLAIYTGLFCFLSCLVPARRLARMHPLEALRGGP